MTVNILNVYIFMMQKTKQDADRTLYEQQRTKFIMQFIVFHQKKSRT